ncbi:MAG: hypothetical protein XD54_1885, partial [Thermococcus sibiricus]
LAVLEEDFAVSPNQQSRVVGAVLVGLKKAKDNVRPVFSRNKTLKE